MMGRIVMGLALCTALAQAQERTPPIAPTLVAPADDPESSRCLSPKGNIELAWREESNGYPVATFVEVRRMDSATKSWHPWVKSYANSSFTIVVNRANPLFFGSTFAWRVWSVDRTGKANPYATASEWWSFCTQAR